MKNVVNRKAILLSVSLIFIVVIIAITSLANAGIDPNYWKSEKFITDTIFTVALVLIGVVIGQAEGDNYFRNKEDGLFVNSYNGYNSKRKIIDNLVDKFSDWASYLFRKEYYKKCIRYLFNDNGIKQAELLLQLDRTQVVQLTEPKMFVLEGKERYFNSLTDEQIKAVLNVLEGKIKIKYVADSYFLNAYSKNNDKSMYEQAGEQEKQKRKKFIILMAYRVILTVLVGMVFTAFVIDNQKEGKNTAQALLNLFIRYFTLFSSVGWGFFIANDMIKDECIFLDYKATTLNQFYLDVEVNKTFKSRTEEEKAFEKISKMLEEGDCEKNGRNNSSS